MSDKIHFKAKSVKMDKGSYVMIQGSIHKQYITKINIYTPNMRYPNM